MYIWRKRATADWLRGEANLLRRFGSALAIIEQPGKARTLVEVSCGTRKEALEIRRELGGAIERLPTDWLEQLAKRNRAKPLRIGSRLIVSRTRAPTVKARTIVIPAEAAFGTGEHATTAMCLRMLERITRRRDTGWSMLDAGTGSGILAIAGSCLGANRIIAIDNDPLACAVAKRNAAANRVHNIEISHRRCSEAEVPGQVRHHHRKPLQRNSDRGLAGVDAVRGEWRLSDSFGDLAFPGANRHHRLASKRFCGARDQEARKMDRTAGTSRRENS